MRTLFMVGQNAKWQKDNFVWWGSYRARAEDIIDARSEATAPTGRYAFMWEGRMTPITAFRRRLHHPYRDQPRARAAHLPHHGVRDRAQKFEKTMDPSPEEGGFTAVFRHYNDLLDYSPD